MGGRLRGVVLVAVAALTIGAVVEPLRLSASSYVPYVSPYVAYVSQEQRPSLTFRSVTNLVEVDAIVTDRDGKFVRDLTRDDFEVFEDGKPMPVSVFTLVDIPIERPDPLLYRESTIEADVVSNVRSTDGRVFVIVLDALHVGATRSALVKQQARRFVEEYLGPNDMAAVVHIGHGTSGQEFTSNRRLLLESIDRFRGEKLRPAGENLARDAIFKADLAVIAAGFLPVEDPVDNEALERGFMARESINSLGRVAGHLSGLSGRRKAVLYFSEGIDLGIIDPPQLQPTSQGPKPPNVSGDPALLRLALHGVLADAARANVSLYTIDPRGLGGSGPDSALMWVPSPSPDMFPQHARVTQEMQQTALDEHRRALDSMRTLADQTGGLAFVTTNDTDGAFKRIVEDNSSYYLLGYVSPDQRRDGRYHRQSIRVKRPGLQVRTRTGYRSANDAEEGGPPDHVSELLASPVPIAGLRMQAHAGVLRRADEVGRVRATIEFDGETVPLTETGGRFTNDIEIGYQAMDGNGTPRVHGRHVLHLKLLPATRAGFAEQGVRYVTEFDLPPGRYQLRVAAREQVSGRTGSVFYDLDVPAFGELSLAMSDLLITSTAAPRTLTGEGAPTIGSRLPSQTTTARAFDRSDTLSVFAGVYDSETRPHTIDFAVSVTADDGSRVFSREDSRTHDSASTETLELPYTLGIPLQTLRPGRYVLTVHARSRLGPEVKKEVEFRVR